MPTTITRKGFLKGAGGAAGAAVAAGAALPATARADTALDATFSSPYQPHLVIGHPSSWYAYTALIPGIGIPYDVVLCNRQLSPLPDSNGGPDLKFVPTDATMLLIFHRPLTPPPLPPSYPLSESIPLNGTSMNFSDLSGGNTKNWWGFRHFLGWWTATGSDGNLYSLAVHVYVGPDAGTEWSDVQSIVDSTHLSA